MPSRSPILAPRGGVWSLSRERATFYDRENVETFQDADIDYADTRIDEIIKPVVDPKLCCPRLPFDIILMIVRLACRRGPWLRGNPVPWLKQLSTLGKDWTVACQSLLFSRFVIRPSDEAHGAGLHLRRLDFFRSRQDLAQYVNTLYLLDTSVHRLVPDLVHLLLTTFPYVDWIDADIGNMDPVLCNALITGQMPVKSLILNDLWHVPWSTRYTEAFTNSTFTTFAFSGPNSMIASLLEALSSSTSVQTITTMELEYSGFGVEFLGTLARFRCLRVLNVTVDNTDYIEPHLNTDESRRNACFRDLTHLSTLRIRVIPVDEDTVDFLRHMFSFCNLPELRSLKVEIIPKDLSQRTRRSYHTFMPFGHLITRIPILPRNLADSLTRLQIEFGDRWNVKNSSDFFDMFGVQSRPGVLQVLGGDLKLE